MDGLIFNCDAKELKHKDLFVNAVYIHETAARKIKNLDESDLQHIIDAYIDFVLADEEGYMKKLSLSKKPEDKTELDVLNACKKIMDLKYWKNYTHLIALFKEGFLAGSNY